MQTVYSYNSLLELWAWKKKLDNTFQHFLGSLYFEKTKRRRLHFTAADSSLFLLKWGVPSLIVYLKGTMLRVLMGNNKVW